MKKLAFILALISGVSGCKYVDFRNDYHDWSVSVIPACVRLDPTTNEIIDHKFLLYRGGEKGKPDLFKSNMIYDGNKVRLFAARGEYISFQLVISKSDGRTFDNMQIQMQEFKSPDNQINIKPELFLEWAVEIKTPSTGYPKASLGKGWYPDALVPFSYIQDDSSKVQGRWIYPLMLPDFNNRIDNQKSMIIWIDQFIPFNQAEAKPGEYHTKLSITTNRQTREIPIDLTVWDFAIPNENRFKAALQHEGFMRDMPEEQELAVYQLLKRNRIAMLDPTYKPDLQMEKNGMPELNWKAFDDRLNKYFSGMAFTKEFGYQYGPGYGEPIETFVLPFDVYGKHGTKGWPETGKPDVERDPQNRSVYVECIRKVRSHLETLIDPHKTDITVYLNGLDESYFPEAWSRMACW